MSAASFVAFLKESALVHLLILVFIDVLVQDFQFSSELLFVLADLVLVVRRNLCVVHSPDEKFLGREVLGIDLLLHFLTLLFTETEGLCCFNHGIKVGQFV